MLKSFLRHPRTSIWRRVFFQVHLWTGVTAGLYMLAISVTGSILVFQRELLNDAPALSSAPLPGPGLSYGQLVEEARRRNPKMTLESIDMRTSGRRLLTLTFRANSRERVFYMDRSRGRILADEDLKQRHPVMVWFERLHNELLGGSAGATANGIGGLLLVTLCCTGIVIWWPGLRVWRRAVAVKWRAGWRRINFDLHSAAGFWTLALVLMWGATGAYFIFPNLIQKPLHLFSIPAAAKHSRWNVGAQLKPIDEYVTSAMACFPGEKLAYLYMDVYRRDGQVAAFLSSDPSVPLTLREDIVHLDPATADVLWTESSRRWSAPERVLMATYSVHFGDFGGLASKCVWSMLSISLSLLTITGYLMWWNRVLRKRWPFRRSSS